MMTETPATPSATGTGNGQPIIHIEGLHKTLNRKPVLAGVDLDIQAGETMVILGRSGEGKSVLLKHIVRLFEPDAGHVYIEGEDIVGLPEDELGRVRRKMGMLFQGAALFDSMTVAENVAFALREHSDLDDAAILDRVVENLRRVRLEGILDKMPAELSGGMKKRVSLARAIAYGAKIVLYDEPTTGLDPITADAINDLIVTMREELGITGVAVTHDIASAFKIADRVSMLHQGRIIYTGTVEETRDPDHPMVRQFIRGEASGPMTDRMAN